MITPYALVMLLSKAYGVLCSDVSERKQVKNEQKEICPTQCMAYYRLTYCNSSGIDVVFIKRLQRIHKKL